jgi:hypothetical protein
MLHGEEGESLPSGKRPKHPKHVRGQPTTQPADELSRRTYPRVRVHCRRFDLRFHINTELTRAIHTLTTEPHRRLLDEPTP